MSPPEDKVLGPEDCPRCGFEVVSEGAVYVTAVGRRWHPQHFVCEVCALPFDDDEHKYFEANDGKVYCSEHLPSQYGQQIRGACAVCGEPVDAQNDYFENMWGEIYHEHHNAQLKECEYCGSAVCQEVKPGQIIACKHCVEVAVTSRKTLESIFEDVRKGMEEIGLRIGDQQVKIGMVQQEQINKNAGVYHQDKASTVLYPSPDVPRKDRVYGILVRNQLPEEYAETQLVHEAMHIWLKMNRFPSNLPPTVCEGLCEYAAYLYLTRPGVGDLEDDEIHRVDEIKFNPDPVFGVGFNACNDAVNLLGSFSSVLGYVKQQLWFPDAKDLKVKHKSNISDTAKGSSDESSDASTLG